MSRRVRNGPFALSLVLIAATGCYVEATGGLYATTGLNHSDWRMTPGFGLSAGIAYDPILSRASLGGGGEAIVTRVGQRDNWVIAGPLVARLDVAAARLGTRSMFRVAGGAAFAASNRFRTADGGTGVVEGRPTNAVQGFVMPSFMWMLGGGHQDHYFVFDLAAGPAGFIMYDNPGLTNLYGVGGQVRVMISLPLSHADGLSIGAGVQNWATVMSSPEMQARIHEEFMENWGRSLDATQRQMQRDNECNAPGVRCVTCPGGMHADRDGMCVSN